MIQRYILSQFSNKLSKLNLNYETYNKKIKEYSISLTLQDIDNKCLRPAKFLKFCELLGITPRKLYDKYYSYVFSNYGNNIIQFRQSHNLTQKQFAKIVNISPVDIGFFEKGLTYPTRDQCKKLKEVLQKYAI